MTLGRDHNAQVLSKHYRTTVSMRVYAISLLAFILLSFSVVVAFSIPSHQRMHCDWRMKNNIPTTSNRLSSKRRHATVDVELSAYDENEMDDILQTSRSGSNNNFVGSKLEALKQREVELAALLAAVRREKLATIRSRPLTIGIVGFGRFGQFIAKTFAKYGTVVVTSRSDYGKVAQALGVTYVSLDEPLQFLSYQPDVIVFGVSILSFQSTIQAFAPHLRAYIDNQKYRNKFPRNRSVGALVSSAALHGPLIVDVLSVKEHARKVMLEYLPEECDILCAHPMFGPDSGKDGWRGLNFVYEKTRINKVVLDQQYPQNNTQESFMDNAGHVHSVHEDSEAHVEGVDRMERFLSIWEEEGCRMVCMSCGEHDAYAANSQFVTHLVGRVLGSQGLSATPIDTSGFQSVLKLVGSTTADSFDLFYGLYKYNGNSVATIKQLQDAMGEVVNMLHQKELEEQEKQNGKASASIGESG